MLTYPDLAGTSACMIVLMARSKLEIIYVQRGGESESGLTILGDFSIDSEGSPALAIGAIGELHTLDLPNKHFSGRIVDKNIIYSQRDAEGKAWDLVTTIIITLEVLSGTPDPQFEEVNKRGISK